MTRHPIVWLVTVIVITLALPLVMLCVALGCICWGVVKILKVGTSAPTQTSHGERR